MHIYAKKGILVDDFGKNLKEWISAGGVGIKFYNGSNGDVTKGCSGDATKGSSGDATKDDTENGTEVANLDLDDTDSYGPETVTVLKMPENGKLMYFVHDYTDRDDPTSNALSLSNAQVRVYKGRQLLKQYFIPRGIVGRYWHVFDMDKHYNVKNKGILHR